MFALLSTQHYFERLVFAETLGRHCRDALHFSDQRVGPTIVDSVVGYTGDDLFNIHTTLMVVVKCETATSCLMVNPHLSGTNTLDISREAAIRRTTAPALY